MKSGLLKKSLKMFISFPSLRLLIWLKICMKTSAITLGPWDVSAIMVFYATFVGVWAWVLDAPSKPLLMLGLAAATLQAVWHFVLIKDRTREGCFKAFRLNHWVGFAVFAGVALSAV
jgi:4-hydroxybenzoate polyprenyltransferase